ncbi:mfs general substrate transporter [Lichtheimia corymbifera JMRC:FSU:9682]|uniref:Mfs general substrate transporter n=1 Tax=Lichtheimia corymbifera JMRC:FSU:9682 TaxID=1263082 RepID=A0A068RXP0_9FUNG|nr:mfs general substrate transporter [Lichtheimia corymbifera JMRC:FSU:9682]
MHLCSFLSQLGIAVLAIVLISISIRDTFRRHHNIRADFFGVLLWFGAAILLILSLSWGGTTYTWSSAVIIALLCVGSVLLVGFGVWEWKGARDPVIPRYVKNRSSILILVSAFCYGGTFQSLMTYVPLYLSVIRQEDSMATNLELLSLVLVACIANVTVGLLIVKTGHYRWAIRSSLTVLVLASGLLQLLKPDSSRGLIVGLMLITGVGVGGMLNSSIVTAQASVSLEHVPAIISLMTLCDLTGGITGITVQAAQVRQSASYLWSLEEPVRSQVISAYMDAVHMSFWGSTGFAAVALLATIGLQAYELRTYLDKDEDEHEDLDSEVEENIDKKQQLPQTTE